MDCGEKGVEEDEIRRACRQRLASCEVLSDDFCPSCLLFEWASVRGTVKAQALIECQDDACDLE